MDTKRFEGKSAIVTGGGGGGIGGAVVRRLAAEGAMVLAADINLEAAEKVAAEAGGGPGKVVPFHADITTVEGNQAMVNAAVDRFGRIDVVVCSATTSEAGPALSISEEGWQRTLDGNVTSAWRAAKLAVPVMAANGGGAFVNISSNAALAAIPGLAAYGAAKAALIQLTRQLAFECADQNIRFNSITPGIISTPGIKAMVAQQGEEQVRAAMVRGFGEPGEVAALVAFLASDDASFVNGENVKVDGGWFAKQDAGGLSFGMPRKA